MMSNFNEQKEKKLLTEDILDGISYSKEKLDMTLSEIGIRLSSERNLQKLSVAQAAIKCGFDISNIYRMESGNNVFLSTFLQYVYALGRPISTFIPFDESGNKPKSLGEQIDELTRGLDVFEKNYILNMVEQLVSFANCK
jgi:transcriptional regulator with XRE-family HTH domain